MNIHGISLMNIGCDDLSADALLYESGTVSLDIGQVALYFDSIGELDCFVGRLAYAAHVITGLSENDFPARSAGCESVPIVPDVQAHIVCPHLNNHQPELWAAG